MSLRLFLAPTANAFAELYRNAADAYNRTPPAERNSGFDLFCDATDVETVYPHVAIVGQGCRAIAVAPDGTPRGFWLAPRSSICKSKWRLANSLGLIDPTYRGVIRAALSAVDGDNRVPASDHEKRYCQLAASDLVPWSEVIIVDELPAPASLRGEGGFGSTGR
jgi:dUTP pyrophosphatase